METINERISLVIKAKIGERRKLAELMHVSPQYVNKIATPGGSVGIEPVITLLRLFPDLDARWLLLGEGKPFHLSDEAEAFRRIIGGRVASLLDIDRYIPFMETAEIATLQTNIESGNYDVSPDMINTWEDRRKTANTLLDNIENAERNRTIN